MTIPSPTPDDLKIELTHDIECLNQMVRMTTGEGQGNINAYAAQCDEIAVLEQRVAHLEKLLADAAGALEPFTKGTAYISIAHGSRAATVLAAIRKEQGAS